MYEVFLNDRSIVIASEKDALFPDSKATISRVGDFSVLQDHLKEFLGGKGERLTLLGDEVSLWEEFRRFFTFIPAAGGIVHGDQGLLFIFRKGRWDLPKGKRDEDETDERAALREVSEETGLSRLTIDGFYPSTWHVYPSPWKNKKGTWILKETKWFSMHVSGNQIPVPETAEEIREARWFSPDALDEVLGNTYASLKNLIHELTGK